MKKEKKLEGRKDKNIREREIDKLTMKEEERRKNRRKYKRIKQRTRIILKKIKQRNKNWKRKKLEGRKDKNIREREIDILAMKEERRKK